MSEPSISIAMCAYNGERYIREQLDSFVAQTRRPDELVVCDDASGDATAAIVTAFARTAPFDVRLHTQPRNVGRIANFEKAISLCTNELIFLSDADDIWHPDKLAVMSRALAAAPNATGVFCDAEVVDATLEPLGYSVFDHCKFTPELQSQLRNNDAFAPLVGSRIVQGAALAFRASCRPMLLPLSAHWGQDSWIAVLLAASGDVLCINDALMSYRQHDANALGVISRRPSRLQRLATRLRNPRQHFREILDKTAHARRQLDDLEQRVLREGPLIHSARLHEAMDRWAWRLQRRRFVIGTLLTILGDRPQAA
jgi:glycosyltransferase involved in cell wall biosynthesis